MQDFMRVALDLAAKGKNQASPRPMVGAVLVKNNRILGTGYYSEKGIHHAEIVALNKVRSSKDATLYVTLEPCFHRGRTPPCVDALIKAKLKNVIIAVKDPNPKVHGKSIAKLRNAGIHVQIGVRQKEAEVLNEEFFTAMKQGRPHISLKAAITLDGKIATRIGKSAWVSSSKSREWVHKKRREVDAILIGKNTLLKDNPRLTARFGKMAYPTRIILVTGPVPPNLKVFTQSGETILLIDRVRKGIKATQIVCKVRKGRIDLKDALKHLISRGIISILVEGGGDVFSQFIKEKLVDRYYFFIAPKLLGDEKAVSFVHGRQISSLAKAIPLSFVSVKTIGDDVLVEARPG